MSSYFSELYPITTSPIIQSDKSSIDLNNSNISYITQRFMQSSISRVQLMYSNISDSLIEEEQYYGGVALLSINDEHLLIEGSTF